MSTRHPRFPTEMLGGAHRGKETRCDRTSAAQGLEGRGWDA